MGDSEQEVISSSEASQRFEWRVERIAWVLAALLFALALLGVFGGGPLSRASAGSSDQTVQVDYERFVRVATSTTLKRSEEHTSELQSRENLVCRLLLEKKNTTEQSTERR